MDNLPTRRDDLNSKRNARERAMDAAAQDLALEDGLSDEGFGLDEGDPPPPYMPTLPEGMETSAGKPQASSFQSQTPCMEGPICWAALRKYFTSIAASSQMNQIAASVCCRALEDC